MNELSLFSGAGGGLLGSKLLGWRTIGYVEFEKYAQQVIAARIADGYLDSAPIFTDVREFIQSGAVDQYRGLVDVVTAGFPCQPFSHAGKRAGEADERNMWPQTMEVLRRTNAPHALLENVPGLLSASVDDESGRPVRYFGTILRDLSEGGYHARYRVVSAADVGAPHRRERLWVFAYLANTAEQGVERHGRSAQTCCTG